MAHQKVGFGIFEWDATERRSNRYGSFHLGATPYAGSDRAVVTLDQELLQSFCGKRVSVHCHVIEARDSTHIGDMFLKILPSRPEVGENIDLGVGTLSTAPAWEPEYTDIAIKPGDGRSELWLDPHKLFRLHDQTVELWIAETDQPFHEAPVCKSEDIGVLDTGDGAFQVKKVEGNTVRLAPEIEKIEDGLFTMALPSSYQRGRRVKVL